MQIKEMFTYTIYKAIQILLLITRPMNILNMDRQLVWQHKKFSTEVVHANVFESIGIASMQTNQGLLE